MKKIEKSDIIIIGAGLAGLTAAYYLKDKCQTIKLIESRPRCGGRILSVNEDDVNIIDLGATWLGSKHQHINKLLDRLDIEIYEQHFGDSAIFEAISTSPPYLASLPKSEAPSYRIVGTSISLINKLIDEIGYQNIILNQTVTDISFKEDLVVTRTADNLYYSDRVISTLPPNLLVSTIHFSPELPIAIMQLAKSTHTWMGESIKIAVTFPQPFWNAANSSGTILSNVGPISEMYDHTDYTSSYYSLMGFLNSAYYNHSKQERKHIVLNQLRKYYGDLIDNYLEYYEKVWRKEIHTFTPYDNHVIPHQNNGHNLYNKTYWDGRLILSGTETSPVFPGYMEGAVYSGLVASKKVLMNPICT